MLLAEFEITNSASVSTQVSSHTIGFQTKNQDEVLPSGRYNFHSTVVQVHELRIDISYQIDNLVIKMA